jgi:transcriptional accessory protein Tex/SPT6
MSVDFEAIAQRGRCDVSSLRLALPLLEQGYTPPFLARYRRDELGGLDESSLWALSAALKNEQHIARRREELHEVWEKTSLQDPAIGQAIKKSNSLRMLARLGRRLKAESHDQATDATRLAARVLNPQKGDGSDFEAIAGKIEGLQDPQAAVAGLDQALAKRLAGDPRVIASAVRWLVKNAKIHVASISDPHTPQEGGKAEANATEEPSSADAEAAASSPAEEPAAVAVANSSDTQTDAADADAATESADTSPAASPSEESTYPSDASATDVTATGDVAAERSAPKATAPEAAVGEQNPSTEEATTKASEPGADATANAIEIVSTPEAETNDSTDVSVDVKAKSEEATSDEAKPANSKEKAKPSKGEPKASKKQKKVSPRQRRRRWLVGVLKPLAGKRFACDKLSSFQIVMLGRALRSQVAQCAFEYDATKLVSELQRTAAGINRHVEQKLRDIVLANEAEIREAAETAWWDDLHERASARLVAITADHLRRHVNRGAVEAKVVMAVDAVGPRTAATSIVSADGRILHNEDLPCQLSAGSRSQAVARMGELIHAYNVDLLVISNGPSRRATMIALSDLIGQSPEASVRWTLADRSGADVYASSTVADEEMRSTPRRFRAAAWLAFSVLQPAQALAKVDPLKLRLSSFQRELSDDAMIGSLEDVIVSGASRGGVDVNSAPVSWLQRLPGVKESVAQAIDRARRSSLFKSRQDIVDLEEWGEATHSRQAIPFLRVFGSEETLDGTLIHPDDYPLAKKLASALGVELPPDVPPGYSPPDFSEPVEPTTAQLVEASTEPEKAAVEDFTAAGESAPEFAVDSDTAASGSEASTSQTQTSDATETETTSVEAAETSIKQASRSVPQQSEAAVESGATDDNTASEEAAASEESANIDAPNEDGATAQSEAAESSSPEASDADSQSPPAADAPVVEVAEPVRHPRPEQAKIDKCIKEWQIGTKRTQQLVQWLCDPFGDSDSTGNPPAVLNTMPSIKGLKQGDSVIGVVVGVMPFGVFVELAPDCSGLIHVSRVSDSYVDDLHEAVQVGDVVTAWVTGIDEKRRRVALSAVSPAREAEIEETRRNRDDRSRGPGRRGGGDRGGQRRGGAGRGDNRGRGDSRGGGDNRGGGARGAGSLGGDARGGKPGGGRGREQGRSRDGGRGGRSRDGRGGGRREKKPESYRVVGKKESKPISDAMQKGEEPLRSFGDLMQFFDQSNPPAEPPTNKKAEAAKSESAPPKPVDEPKADDSAQQENQKPPADQSSSTSEPASTPPAEAASNPVASDATAGSDAASSDSSATDKPSSSADTTTS